MVENFNAYIDGMGTLDDSDLFLDIDETMKKREKYSFYTHGTVDLDIPLGVQSNQVKEE